MGLVIDKLTGNIYLFDIPTSSGGTGTGGTASYPQVNTFSQLPAAGSHNGEIYVVLQSTGLYVVNRKEAGLYYSNSISWTRLGDIPSFFNDDNFQVYDGTDNTKKIRFQLSGLTTNSLRTITMRNSDGTIAYLTDLNTKVDKSVFSGYTATTKTKIDGKLSLTGGTMTGNILFSSDGSVDGIFGRIKKNSTYNAIEIDGREGIFLNSPFLVNPNFSGFSGSFLTVGDAGQITLTSVYTGSTSWQDTIPSSVPVVANTPVNLGLSVSPTTDVYTGTIEWSIDFFNGTNQEAIVVLQPLINSVVSGSSVTYTVPKNTTNRLFGSIPLGHTIFSGDSIDVRVTSNKNGTVPYALVKLITHSPSSTTVTWSKIFGNILNQTDLQNQFATKVDYSLFTGYTATTETRLENIESQLTGGTPSSIHAIQVIDLVGGINVNGISPTSIQWTNVEFTGNSLSYTGASRIYIQTTGNYEISYNLVLKNGDNLSKSIGSVIKMNGTTNVTPLSVAAYIDNGSSITGSNNIANYKRAFNAGDYVELQAFRISNSGTVTTVPGASWIRIIKT